MNSFEDLLKKAKQNTKPKDDKKTWKNYISSIISIVNKLNDMYNNDKHNLKLKLASCDKCSKATYILAVKDIDSPHKPVHFYKSKWKHKDGKYLCEDCK